MNSRGLQGEPGRVGTLLKYRCSAFPSLFALGVIPAAIETANSLWQFLASVFLAFPSFSFNFK